jgi:nitrilase
MEALSHVAVVQAGSVLFDPDATIAKTADFARDVASRGAKIVVFPEAFIGGYPKGMDFGARVGMRTDEGREQFRRYYDGAIAVPGPHCSQLGSIAKSNGLYLVIGVIERDGGTLYCTVLFFAPDGALLAKHRKLMPTVAEKLIWGFGDGSTLPVLDTPHGKLGAVICWENYMPLLRTAMFAKGIQLYCAPTVDDRERWTSTMRHIALEGRCFVLAACQYNELIAGGSAIIDPAGTLLAGPARGSETILTAELDLADIKRTKWEFDATGHYSRPDIFSLLVNESPMPSVEFLSEDPVEPRS